MLLKEKVVPGRTTAEINDFCENFIIKNRAVPALKGYNSFPSASCISVNTVAAHGIPGAYVLSEGDIVSIDVAVEKNGWYGDGAWTFSTGGVDKDGIRLIKAAWQSSLSGVKNAKAGNRFGDLGAAIAGKASQFGCAVVRDLAGHGIGKHLHEEPKILHFGEPGTGSPIVAGMVFTVEPIISFGDIQLKVLGDGWSQVTKDNSRTAQFEHTVAVFGSRTEVLTMSQLRIEDYPDYPPY